MSIDYHIDGCNFDDYFNALISPQHVDKRQEIIREFKKLKDSSNEKMNLIPKLEPNLIANNMNTNTMGNFNVNMMNMISNLNPVNIPNTNTVPINMNQNEEIHKPIRKRKSLAETSKDVLVKEDGSSPEKKNKKTPKVPKKKKEAPKRKRVNYCFEIHRSGCALNKDSKLYCKVYLKGKLQSEVDLIKGARGKWAYTFYDQRKKKKERRYWPSQSSGPVIEDTCNCDKCVPSSIPEEEADFSSPSTEEANNLIEYDQFPQGVNHHQDSIQQQLQQQLQHQLHHQQLQQHEEYQQPIQQFVYYNNHMQVPINYNNNNEYSQHEYNQYIMNQKNIALKSSNDFQDKGYYLKSSTNGEANHLNRPWENYFQPNNVMEYNDGFFVENNFL